MIRIILIHGLGSNSWSLVPVKLYLQWVAGLSEVYLVDYPVDELGVDECLDYLDAEIARVADKKADELIVVGQSMGGVFSNRMHTKGWTVRHAVYIGSPLHGANLLNQLDRVLPTTVRNYMYKKKPLMYDYLMTKEREDEPPHSYNTITMAWPGTQFDGCVYKDEAHMDPEKNIHLACADHRTVFGNPRLWTTVYRCIRDHASGRDGHTGHA